MRLASLKACLSGDPSSDTSRTRSLPSLTSLSIPLLSRSLSRSHSLTLTLPLRYGVPYFRDTTPTWSTRGKLRRQLVPLLIDMYGSGCLRNISSLAAQSDEAMTLVSQNIYDPFMRSLSVSHSPHPLLYATGPFRDSLVVSFSTFSPHVINHSVSGKKCSRPSCTP
jgi:hypothetical protein